MSKQDLEKSIDHIINTLEAAAALTARDSLVQCMIDGAIQELEAIKKEEI